ncbi:MAG: HAD hydrolase-like protein [Myxococcota bacterium]|jgi:phosphoglycolate phosphatase|nr:HAD hydrolase-like protein [Myxococcota bacterium]
MSVMRPERPLGVVIFDLDGTLVDTSGDIVAAANYVRSLAGKVPLLPSQVLAFVGKGAHYLIEGVLELCDETEVEQFLVLYQNNYRDHQGENSALYPGIREGLEELARDFDLYVLSNKPHEAVVTELMIHGLANTFRAAFGAGSLSALKPSPVGVLLAMELSGLPPLRSVMVGDSPQDVLAGRAAGAKVIHTQWGYSQLSSDDPVPDVAISDPKALSRTIYEVLIGGNPREQIQDA